MSDIVFADAKVNGSVFLRLNATTLNELKVSFGFREAVLGVIDKLVINLVCMLSLW